MKGSSGAAGGRCCWRLYRLAVTTHCKMCSAAALGARRLSFRATGLSTLTPMAQSQSQSSPHHRHRCWPPRSTPAWPSPSRSASRCRGRRGALALGGRRGGARHPPCSPLHLRPARLRSDDGGSGARRVGRRAAIQMATVCIAMQPRRRAGRRRRFANRAGEQLAPLQREAFGAARDCARQGQRSSASSRTRESGNCRVPR